MIGTPVSASYCHVQLGPSAHPRPDVELEDLVGLVHEGVEHNVGLKGVEICRVIVLRRITAQRARVPVVLTLTASGSRGTAACSALLVFPLGLALP